MAPAWLVARDVERRGDWGEEGSIEVVFHQLWNNRGGTRMIGIRLIEFFFRAQVRELKRKGHEEGDFHRRDLEGKERALVEPKKPGIGGDRGSR